MNQLVQSGVYLASGNLADKGLVGKLIDWLLVSLLGQDYENNALTIFGVPIGIIMVISGIILLGIWGTKTLKGQKEEARKDLIAGLALLGIGVMAVVFIMAFADSVKSM